MQGTLTWLAGRVDANNAALKGNAAALRSMTEFSTNAFVAAGQLLLDERERAFMASCDIVCVITDTAGWPSIRMLDPKSAALEVVNSQALRLQLAQPLNEVAKLALLLIRHSDGQYLTIHGHVSSRSSHAEEGPRVRIAVASRSWSPEGVSGMDFSSSLTRALSSY